MANKRIKKKLQNRENVSRETIYRGSRKQAKARYNRREARRKLNAERRRKKEERQIQKAKEAEQRRTERKARAEQEKQFEREQIAEQRAELPAATPPEVVQPPQEITRESQPEPKERTDRGQEEQAARARREQAQEVAKFESVARHVVNEFIASFKYYPKGIYELLAFRINAMRKQYGYTAVYQMIMEFPQTLDEYLTAGVYENSEDATNAYLSDMLNYLPGLTYEDRESLESYFEMAENGDNYAI